MTLYFTNKSEREVCEIRLICFLQIIQWHKIDSILSPNKMLLCYKHPKRFNHLFVLVICISQKATFNTPTILCYSTFFPGNSDNSSLHVEFFKPFKGLRRFGEGILLHTTQRYSQGIISP